MNKLDSELVTGILESEGLEAARDIDSADVILFNTCSVRDHAENKFFSHLGRVKEIKRKRPDVVVGVLGCTAERLGEDIIRRMPHVDFVCGPGRLGLIGRIIKGNIKERCLNGFIESDRIIAARTRRRADVKAFVSIMRGCDCRCSYCVVPSVRGPETSRPAAEIIDEIKELEQCGVREVTLLGQSVDRYGVDLEPRSGLADLLRLIDRNCRIDRLRFVTSNPRGVTPELIEAMADLPCVCESLHMPAQSGSNRILKAMGRSYTSEKYLSVVEKAAKLIPGIELSSDFIVGFPGETDEDFSATLELVKGIRFLQGFIFKYSPRDGTKAARLDDDVSCEVKARRHTRLLEAQNDITLEKHQALVGREVEVLVEGPSKNDSSRFVGRTRQNHIVIFDPGKAKPGNLTSIHIKNCTHISLYA